MRQIIRLRNKRKSVSCTSLRFQSTFREKYPFPTKPKPSPHEIFHLSPDASPADIKTRYFELVRQYHPDAFQGQDINPAIIESRFHAVTTAYNFLTQRTGLGSGLAQGDGAALDPEAQKIKERLAAWATADARRPTSVFDQERRQRALEAEAAVGRWFKSDYALYYLMTGTAIAIAVMHIQGRPAAQKERVRKYLETRKQDSGS